MSYIGTTKIGGIYLGTTSIGKAYLGDVLVFQKGGGLPASFTLLEYLETNGANYMLSPVVFEQGKRFDAIIDMQFLVQDSGKGTGWNAGGAVAQRGAGGNFHYSDGSGSDLSPALSYDQRALVSIAMKTNGQTDVSAVHNGVTSSHTRANTSLRTYAGTTGFPIGCMTGSGGSVPSSGTSIRFYSVKIQKEGATLFNAVPVISTESVENDQGATVPTGTVGLYDFVTQKFYTNRGNGQQDFTPGYIQS